MRGVAQHLFDFFERCAFAADGIARADFHHVRRLAAAFAVDAVARQHQIAGKPARQRAGVDAHAIAKQIRDELPVDVAGCKSAGEFELRLKALRRLQRCLVEFATEKIHKAAHRIDDADTEQVFQLLQGEKMPVATGACRQRGTHRDFRLRKPRA